MTLMLQGSWNPDASATAPLCHRLKEDYQPRKNDLGVKDGRELVITFDRAPNGPNKGVGSSLTFAGDPHHHRTPTLTADATSGPSVRRGSRLTSTARRTGSSAPAVQSVRYAR